MVTIDDEKNKLSLKPTVSYLKTVTEVFCSSELSLFLFPVLNFQFFFCRAIIHHYHLHNIFYIPQ